jgi:hypothetical protein
MKGAFAHLLNQRMTFDDHMEVDYVLDAAVEWQEGRLPTAQAAQIGTITRNGHPSSGYTRFVALFLTPRQDVRWDALYNLISHLDQLQGGVHTRQGRFTKAEADFVQRDNDRLYASGHAWNGVR